MTLYNGRSFASFVSTSKNSQLSSLSLPYSFPTIIQNSGRTTYNSFRPLLPSRTMLSMSLITPTTTNIVMRMTSWIRPILPYIPAGVYLTVEIVFLITFFTYMIPKANRFTKPTPYRDYPHVQDRINLMLRIMYRIERTCQQTKTNRSKATGPILLMRS